MKLQRLTKADYLHLKVVKQHNLLLEELKGLVNSIHINKTLNVAYRDVIPFDDIAMDVENAEKLIQQIEGEEDGS